MSERPAPPDPVAEIDRLQRELAAQNELIQSVRTELIRSQIVVLELQDTVLQKETDKADAVSLLGKAELVLEQKINYIFDLDRALNERITDLRQQLAQEQQAHEADRKVRDDIARDLAAKLDATNRSLGDAHALAGNYARQAADVQRKLDATSADLVACRNELEAARARIWQMSTQLDQLSARAATAEADAAAHAAELRATHESLSWKLSAPLRLLSGSKTKVAPAAGPLAKSEGDAAARTSGQHGS